jgi:hypothetical protein
MGWLLGNQVTSHQAERERELRGWLEMEKEGGREVETEMARESREREYRG